MYQLWFRRLATITIFLVYFLILVGGIVRSTGSGMGCPDWPKCFGQWIPPTDVSELPADYKEVYAEKRRQKNLRLADVIEGLGWHKLATRLRYDQSMYQEADFNAMKTWIEYINRLIGVLIGFFVLLTCGASFSYWHSKRIIPILCITSVLLTGFQGWIGSIVVSTNLLGGMITFHMMLAILMVFLLMYVRTIAQANAKPVPALPQYFLAAVSLAIALSIIQVVLGTQVRESVDIVAKTLGEQARGTWLESIGLGFYIHRSFSWAVLGANIWLVYALRQSDSSLRTWSKYLIASVIFEILTGAAMAYGAIPPYLQPLHLVWAIVILGIQFQMFLEKFGQLSPKIVEQTLAQAV